MLGVALISFLDPELQEKHKDMEFQAKLNQANRDDEHAVALARIAVRRKHLEHTVRELEAAINSPESLAHIKRHALEMNAGLLTEMSGRSLPNPAALSQEEAAELERRSVDEGRGKKKSVASAQRRSLTRSGAPIGKQASGRRISPRMSETGTRRTCKRFDGWASLMNW
jgi:hypothetical protein